MARRRIHPPETSGLFEAQEAELERRIRRQRALFIPHLLRAAAADQRLHDAAQDHAYAIALRWADLEKAGHLPAYRERSVDNQFLQQFFGEALGYREKTRSPNNWDLEHQFHVKDVGPADAALGNFPVDKSPRVVIELKDATVDLDRTRLNGRTPVQQCWDYLNALPDCPWGIVSNFRTIRLYHKSRGNQHYEEYTLQELRDRDSFNDFYCLFQRDGLLPSRTGQPPRAELLLKKTLERQKEVGDELYRFYQAQRVALIEHLHKDLKKDLNEAIRIAQKLLDRIIFIAFCEDRNLLPEKTLETTRDEIRTYSRAKNPAWESFLDLFRAIDEGAPGGKREITAFNGGLFEPDPAIDKLDLEARRWTDAFVTFGAWDFSEEVNVEVLGHLFERSITELEKLRVGGLFALAANVEPPASPPGAMPTALRGHAKKEKQTAPPAAKMSKSAQRKRFGIYYTPPAFTGLIVERTVDTLVHERFTALGQKLGVDPDARDNGVPAKLLAYWQACLDELKTVTVCDPACGSGAFLIRAYDALEAWYMTVVHGLAGAGLPPDEVRLLEDAIPDLILSKNLFGVDLSREGVEITQLALWIRSARRGKTLADLSHNIVHGNSLVSDPAVDPHALDWAKTFPEVFAAGGFSCVIGNPPWEQIMVYEKEFFYDLSNEIAFAPNAAMRKKLIEKLQDSDPELLSLYTEQCTKTEKLAKYVGACTLYPLTGIGRANLYALFAELAQRLVSPIGSIGLLVPSGIATDDRTKEFFKAVVSNNCLRSLYDFENRQGVFPDVDPRFRFSVLLLNGKDLTNTSFDSLFFCQEIADVSHKKKRISLTAKDIHLINPNTGNCPTFRTIADATLTKRIYQTVPILINETRRQGGNPWNLRFKQGMVNQSSDSKYFKDAKYFKTNGFKLSSNIWQKGKTRYLPLYEAKMVQAYDHRAANVVVESNNWVRQGQTEATTLVEHQNPEYVSIPRWWVRATVLTEEFDIQLRWGYVAFKDITSATNTRTMIAAAVPWSAIPHPLPFITTDKSTTLEICLLGNMNSFVFDYVARQKVGGNHLTFYIVKQLPTLHPEVYADKCPWSKKETLEHWISERVLKLSCTAEDMIPLAKACHFKGSRGDGVHIWNERERTQLRAELDAAYFHLYGIGRDDVEYILGTFTNSGLLPEDQRKQGKLFAPHSTGEIILDCYDRIAAG